MFLEPNTKVTAKSSGAYCKAKIKSVEKMGSITTRTKSGSIVKIDHTDYISGDLKSSSPIHVRISNVEKEVTFLHSTDHSIYTVVFNDGDEIKVGRRQIKQIDGNYSSAIHRETSPRATKRKVKSASRNETPAKAERGEPPFVGEIVILPDCDKESTKEFPIPALVCCPSANPLGNSLTAEQSLVRSFHDGNFYVVERPGFAPFIRKKIRSSPESKIYRTLEKSCIYYDLKKLPENWPEDILIGNMTIESKNKTAVDSESSEEALEDKDLFVAHFFKFLEDCGTPINSTPLLGDKEIDYYEFFKVVKNLGGYKKVSRDVKWHLVREKLRSYECETQQVRQAYMKYLSQFEDFNKKFGFVVHNRSTGIISGASWRQDNNQTARPSIHQYKKRMSLLSPKVNYAQPRKISRLSTESVLKDDSFRQIRDEYIIPGVAFQISTDDPSVTHKVKITGVEEREDGQYYHIHYVGWNSKFDELFDEATLWMLLMEVKSNLKKLGIVADDSTDDNYSKEKVEDNTRVAEPSEDVDQSVTSCVKEGDVPDPQNVKKEDGVEEQQTVTSIIPRGGSYVTKLADNFSKMESESEMTDFITEYNRKILNLDEGEELVGEEQCVFWESKLIQLHKLYKKSRSLRNVIVRTMDKNKKKRDMELNKGPI